MSGTYVTAIVLTLNEEEHLPDCLQSLEGLADRTIVVDSGSTDRTVSIASWHGAEIYHSTMVGFADQRNKALGFAYPSDWVLFLDADERLTHESRIEIRRQIAEASDDVAGFWIPRRNIAFGRTLKGGGWWPDYQGRIIRMGRGRYDEAREVHEVVVFDGSTARLREPLVHINYASRLEFMHKQRDYTLCHARAAQEARPRLRSYLGRPSREFVRRFLLLRGFRDGRDGLFMAAVMAFEEVRLCRLLRERKGEPQ